MTRPSAGPRVVAFGGGHGLAASLAALTGLTTRLTAVVTVADDGGSSGRLRRELAVLPPGDLRMALAALAGVGEPEQTWARLVQHRFPGAGPVGGHAVGNLLLAGLVDLLADPVAALGLAGDLLGLPAGTRVLPMSCQPVHIAASVAGPDGEVSTVRGQVAVATAPGRVLSVQLDPPAPEPCPEALEDVAAADVVVLGPGSLFTSVLPHLLVPGLRTAVCAARAARVLVLNLAPQPGETAGFNPETHLDVLARQVPELGVDVVVADRAAVPDPSALRAAAARLGARVHVADVADPGRPATHDPRRLRPALAQVFEQLSQSCGRS